MNQNQELTTVILQILLKYGPDAYQAAFNLIHKQTTTLEDWTALLDIINKPLHGD